MKINAVCNIAVLGLCVAAICVWCGRNPDRTQFDVSVDKDGVYMPVTIGDTTIMMLWDTGCTETVIPSKLAEKLNLRIDGHKTLNISTWADVVEDDGQNKGLSDTSILLRYADQISLKIGKLDLKCTPIIDNTTRDVAMIGTNELNRYYYALNLYSQQMTLSNSPLTFNQYDIVDSLILTHHHANDGATRMSQYKVRVDSDSISLVVDSGLRLSFKNLTNGVSLYYDLVLMSGDSINRSGRLMSKIRKRNKIKLRLPLVDEPLDEVVYDDNFSINSYRITSYIPLLLGSIYADRDMDGYLGFPFLARFDIIYYDRDSRDLRLYKFRNSRNLMRDVSIEEFTKGVERRYVQ